MLVEYVTHSGDDALVVNAARVSLDKHHEVFDETTDIRLLNYLAKHNHFTPFTHPTITLRFTVPLFLDGQIVTHKVGFTRNQISRRYVDTEPTFYSPNKLGARAENKKQGSKEGEFIDQIYDGRWDSIEEVTQTHYAHCLHLYKMLLENGVAPEDARIVLPLATYTSYYLTGSLSAYFRMFDLRSKKDAQYQWQFITKRLNEILSELFPHSWSALKGANSAG